MMSPLHLQYGNWRPQYCIKWIGKWVIAWDISKDILSRDQWCKDTFQLYQHVNLLTWSYPFVFNSNFAFHMFHFSLDLFIKGKKIRLSSVNSRVGFEDLCGCFWILVLIIIIMCIWTYIHNINCQLRKRHMFKWKSFVVICTVILWWYFSSFQKYAIYIYER